MIVEFESGIYEVNEDAGVVSLTLVKRTPTTQSVTVFISTANGSATGGMGSIKFETCKLKVFMVHMYT